MVETRFADRAHPRPPGLGRHGITRRRGVAAAVHVQPLRRPRRTSPRAVADRRPRHRVQATPVHRRRSADPAQVGLRFRRDRRPDLRRRRRLSCDRTLDRARLRAAPHRPGRITAPGQLARQGTKRPAKLRDDEAAGGGRRTLATTTDTVDELAARVGRRDLPACPPTCPGPPCSSSRNAVARAGRRRPRQRRRGSPIDAAKGRAALISRIRTRRDSRRSRVHFTVTRAGDPAITGRPPSPRAGHDAVRRRFTSSRRHWPRPQV
ncbi:hypothetical protein HBB16_19805 [Pseudonocardia sp. MCCB 268]|nr:hypothetical protein [Pseudonocardia cytotoxica]